MNTLVENLMKTNTKIIFIVVCDHFLSVIGIGASAGQDYL